MSGRIVVRVLIGIAGLLLLAAGGLAAFLYLPAFEGRRQAVVEELFQRVFERPAEVTGPVRVSFGAVSEVTLEAITVGVGPPGVWGGTLAVREARFGFALAPALFGDFRLESFAATGLAADLSATEADPNAGPFRAGAVVVPIIKLLDAGITRSFTIEQASIVRQGDPDGWNGEATIAQLVARENDEAGSRVVTLDGALDGAPLHLEADFGAPYGDAGARRQRDFTILSTVPGVEQRLEGTIDAAGETLTATLAMRLASLGDMLEVLRLRRQLEGAGSLSMRLQGEIDALVASALRLEMQLATGERLEMQGGIGNLGTLTGIDLAFQASLLRDDGANAPLEAFDIELQTVEGRIAGTARAATLSGLLLDTNIAAADIAEIGPVSVERVTRDDDGQLGLHGIHILSGDPARPSLDLRGEVEDLLGRRGIRLEGGFDLDFLELATGVPGAKTLGRLVGEVGIGDASGSLRLENLNARIAGGGPLAFSLVKQAGGTATSAPSDLSLDIPDLDALARALGAEPVGGGGVSFTGQIDIIDDMHVTGDGRIGQTAFTTDIRQDVVGDQVTFKGRVASPGLHLADIQRLAALPELVPQAAGGDDQGGGERQARSLDAALDVEAAIVDADGAGQGAFAAQLYYHDGEAALRPFQLDYLGGRLEAEMVIGTPETGSPVTLQGSARRMDLASLLRELGAPALVTGTLDGRFDLRARGTEPTAARASLGGMVEAWVEDGTIGTNLVDLTGQDLVSWLISRGSATRLVCADMRLDFTDGRGTFSRLILETENVQIQGTGSLDLGRDSIGLTFQPRPLRERLLGTVTPFRIEGRLSQPSVAIQSGVGIAGRAITETLALPFNVLGAILGGGGSSNRRPCVLVE